MHPSICDFISTTVYDDRLQAEPSTALRVIKVPDGTDRLRVEVGLHFVPVVHEGNSRSSEEEAEMIKALAHELLGREKTDTSGTVIGTIGWEDMLFVAPYNVQVNCYSRYWETKPKWARWIGFKGRNRRLYSCPCAPVQSKIQLVASTFCSTKTA
jgi:hypothetical protein